MESSIFDPMSSVDLTHAAGRDGFSLARFLTWLAGEGDGDRWFWSPTSPAKPFAC